MANNMELAPTLYTTFTKIQRPLIVGVVASTAWFSTLSSFIYYPILPLLANELHTTTERINLTITSYLAISGVAPSIAGDAVDMFGRRPIYLVVLTIYVLANLGLALQGSFTLLLLLRMLQSAGVSGM